MKMTRYIYLLLLVGLVSCKSQFEKVRASNDPEKVLKEADRYFQEEDYTKAQILFEQVIPFYRGKEKAEDLFFKFAQTHYHLKEYMLAAHYYKSFANTYFNSPKKEEALFMSAYSHYEMSPNTRLDQTPSEDAINQLQDFINLYPSSPRVDEANSLIDEMRAKMELKAYQEGNLYYDLKNYNSAIASYERLLKDFPETSRGEEIRYLIIEASYNWAIKSVYEKREERLIKTLELVDKFKKKYDKSSYSKNLKNIINQCQKDLKRFEND